MGIKNIFVITLQIEIYYNVFHTYLSLGIFFQKKQSNLCIHTKDFYVNAYLSVTVK